MTMRVTRFLQVALGLCFAGVFCCGEINGGGGVGAGPGLGGDHGVGASRASSGTAVEPLLPSSLVLASGTYTAAARFEGTDAAAGGWTEKIGGVTATLGGVTNDPTYGVATPFTTPTAVTFNTGKSFVAPNNTLGDVAAGEDLVLEAIFKYNSNGAENAVAGKYSAGGWLIVGGTATNQLIYYGSNTLNGGAPSLTNGTWYHVMVFIDRDGNSRLYRNTAGTALASTATTTATSMSKATPLNIGAYTNGGSGKSANTIALFQVWNLASGSVGSDANCDAVALARYQAARAKGLP